MVATLVFAQMLSGLAPLFTFSVKAEGTNEPTQVVQELSPTPTETPLPTESPVPTVEPTEMPTGTPVPTDVVIPESVATPTPNITINPNEQVCNTNGSVRNSVNSEWSFNSATGIAETKSKVELGVTYVFPLDSKVTVTFNCLPKDESLRKSLKIERMSVSELNLPVGTKASSDFAYDITTEMNDGAFKYDVTLPKTVGTNPEVSYMENTGSKLITIDDSKLDQSNESVKANDLDHFTIFIVTSTVKLTGTVNGLSQVTVAPSASITVTLNVSTSGSGSSNDWNSSQYRIGSGNWNCVDTPNHNGTNSYTESFNITAPSSAGTYNLTLRAYNGNSCSGGVSNDTLMSNAIIVQAPSPTPTITPTVTNPSLAQACGLDIALVLDTSYSIDDGELTQMRNAFKAMVDSLVGTPTQFSVSRFSDTASVLQAFTSDTTLVKSKIDSADGGTYTNWQDGLTKAWGTFGGRADKPNLVIFASDGNPNRTGISGTDVSESQAVSDAVIIANTIKTSGTRILGLGIGSDLNTVNMSAITGPNVNTGNVTTSDVITTDFATMAVQLSNFAKQTCGGKISVNKYVDGVQKSDGQTWSFQIDGTTTITTDAQGQVASGTLSVGNHSITETSIPSGYTFDHATCTNGTPSGNGVTGIALTADSIITCNFYNTTNKGSITLVKNTVGGNGTFTFNTTGGLTPASPSITTVGNTGSVTFPNLTLGTYTISENVPSDWVLSSATCSDGSPITAISLQNNENIVCTFTNTKVAKITLVKTISNNNGGNALVTDWTLKAENASKTITGKVGDSSITNAIVPAGTYTLSELNGPSGYLASGWNCTGATSTTSTSVTLASGQNVTCTINNDDIAAKITVIKDVVYTNGGNALASDFTITINGLTVPAGASFAGAGSPGVTREVSPGTYNISETGPSGYLSVNPSSGCSGTISLGQTKICTLTNESQLATLIVKKHVVNDNGGSKVSSDFAMRVTGNQPSSGLFNGSETGTTISIKAGSYGIDEDSHDGYTKTIGADCSGSIGVGETKTCTITNDDIAPKLTLVKTVTNNNGGNKQVSDFVLKIGSTVVTSGVQNTINAGTYTASEENLLGYSAGNWGGDCNSNGTITLNSGDVKTCTITNDDIQPQIKVVKVVVNNNGGTKQIADFPLYVGSTLVNSGATNSFDVGEYTISETGQTGYAATFSGDCDSTGKVDLNLGDSLKTCTITNDDIQPVLTVKKIVENNFGGNLGASEFKMYVKVTDNNELITSFDGSTIGTPVSLNSGSYKISEDSVFGYNLSFGGDCSSNGTIQLGIGDNKTCELTNKDIQPQLKVIKHVITNDGGTLNASNFTMQASGVNISQTSFDGSESGTYLTLNAGAYSVDEISAAGYTKTVGSDCSGTIGIGDSKICTITNDDQTAKIIVIKDVKNDNGGIKTAGDFEMTINNVTAVGGNTFAGMASPGVTKSLSTVGSYKVTEKEDNGYASSYSPECSGTIALGETKTCTITNDDMAPSLTLDKVLVKDNGGSAVESNWTISAVGTVVSPTDLSGAGAVGNADVVSDNTFKADTYTLSESVGPSGYVGSTWSCIKNSDSAVLGNTISIDLNDKVVCTVTNDDQPAHLTLVKTLTNDWGGNSSVNDWTLTATRETTSISGKTGESSITNAPVSAGTYSLSESGSVTGYTQGTWSCTGVTNTGNSITLENGQSATCTINNTAQPAKLIVKKVLPNDNGGNAKPQDFKFSVNGGIPANFENDGQNDIELPAGTYTIVETNPNPGYTVTTSNCTDVILGNGDTKTCTITNDDIAPKLTLVKTVTNNNGGTKQVADFTLKIGSTVVTSGVENTLSVGNFTVSEINLPGYSSSVWGGNCSSDGKITLLPGDVKTCTITNDDKAPKLTLNKILVKDNGGIAVESNWTLKAVGTIVNPTNLSGAGSIGSNDVVSNASFKADTYTLSEVGSVTGYSASSWSCSKNGGSYVNGSIVTINVGDDVKCKITNDDIKPTIQLIKVVENNFGGTMKVSDFPLKVTWWTGIFPHVNSFTSEQIKSYDAGTYYAGETQKYGYTASYSGACDENGKIILHVGDNAVCTITNKDIQPILIVKKYVDNDFGGTLHSSNFTLNVNNTTDNTLVKSFSGSQSGEILNVNQGTYKVSENNVTGYEMTENCGVHDNGIIDLKVGDVKTCIVKNHDIQPQLKVIKHVINNNGGTKHAFDFIITVAGNHAFPFIFLGSESGINVGMHAGEFNVQEFESSQYAASYVGCTGTIDIGETKTCTITNNDIAPKLKIIKTVINDNGGTLGVSDFKFNVDGNDVSTNVTDNTFITLNAGRHYAGETAVYGYESSIWGGDCRWDGKITLTPGDVKTCTITNNDIAPKLKILNYNDTASPGQYGYGFWNPGVSLDQPIFNNQFQLLGTDNSIIKSTDNVGEIDFTGFVPGDYQLINNLWTNWRYTDITCSDDQVISDLNLQIGDDVTCSYGQQTSQLLITKSKPDGEPSSYRVNDLVNFRINIEVPTEVGVPGHSEKYNTTDMLDVEVTDVLSKGFTYSPASIHYPDTFNGNNGVWNFDKITRGLNIPIDYTAVIGSTIDPGNYKDLAWAQGHIGELEEVSSEDLFRVSANDGYDPIKILALDEPTKTTHFVGLGTNVVEDPVTPEQGVVLGEKTVRLPRTGSESLDMLIIAITISALGASALVMSILMERKQKVFVAGSNLKGKSKMKKNFLKFSAFLGISMLFLAFGGIFNPVHAEDLQTLKIEQPESPTNKTSIDVTYVAYDLSNTPLKVNCSVQKLPAGVVNAVVSNDETANSGTCTIPFSYISENGDYLITAHNDVSGGKSASVNVTIDRVSPPTPVVYNKVSPETCKNRIDFTTGIDSDATPTVKVDIYRGESTNFTAGPITFLESVNVGPGVASSSAVFTLPDCSKTYYYAIQAVDSIGNRSGFVGDIGINVVYYITTTPTPTGTGTNTNGGTTNGSVTPTPGTTGNPNGGVDTGNNDGLVAGTTDNTDQATMNNNLLIIFIVIGVIVLAGFIFEIRINKEPGK